MPYYEYECEKCGTFDEFQKITDPEITICKTCGGKVKRLISSTSFHLKGSGWFRDSYSKSKSEEKLGD